MSTYRTHAASHPHRGAIKCPCSCWLKPGLQSLAVPAVCSQVQGPCVGAAELIFHAICFKLQPVHAFWMSQCLEHTSQAQLADMAALIMWLAMMLLALAGAERLNSSSSLSPAVLGVFDPPPKQLSPGTYIAPSLQPVIAPPPPLPPGSSPFSGNAFLFGSSGVRTHRTHKSHLVWASAWPCYVAHPAMHTGQQCGRIQQLWLWGPATGSVAICFCGELRDGNDVGVGEIGTQLH